ncbi:hypothetical protein [Xanthomonas cucurbitae]|uniref:hypothetical protein n=1 Tax=Xanthomonas cucurbitae TaxID=56453 RepID=UPI000CEEA5E1
MDRSELRLHLERLDAAVPALRASSPDRRHFGDSFASMAIGGGGRHERVRTSVGLRSWEIGVIVALIPSRWCVSALRSGRSEGRCGEP